jgi:hypothetical protein
MGKGFFEESEILRVELGNDAFLSVTNRELRTKNFSMEVDLIDGIEVRKEDSGVPSENSGCLGCFVTLILVGGLLFAIFTSLSGILILGLGALLFGSYFLGSFLGESTAAIGDFIGKSMAGKKPCFSVIAKNMNGFEKEITRFWNEEDAKGLANTVISAINQVSFVSKIDLIEP